MSATDGRGHDVPEGGDVLVGGAAQPSPLARRWASSSPRRRRAAAGALAAAVAAVVVVLAAQQLSGWNLEQRRRDEVALAATLDVSSISTVGSGRVDYFAVVRNLSPRPVRLDGLELTTASLHITSHQLPGVPVPSGGAVDVPISVRLDCAGGTQAGVLSVAILTTPESGRQQTVRLALDHAFLVTDVAATVCRVRPYLTDLELSGPVT